MTPVPGDDVAAWAGLLRGLEVDADLTVEVEDGSGRRARGPLTSVSGVDPGARRLRWEVDRPEVALTALAGTTGGGVIGRRGRRRRRALTTALAGSGRRAELAGPAGVVASVEPDHPRRWAAWTTGSPHLHLEPAAVRALGGPVAAGAIGWVAAAVVVGVLLRVVVRRGPARG